MANANRRRKRAEGCGAGAEPLERKTIQSGQRSELVWRRVNADYAGGIIAAEMIIDGISTDRCVKSY